VAAARRASRCCSGRLQAGEFPFPASSANSVSLGVLCVDSSPFCWVFLTRRPPSQIVGFVADVSYTGRPTPANGPYPQASRTPSAHPVARLRIRIFSRLSKSYRHSQRELRRASFSGRPGHVSSFRRARLPGRWKSQRQNHARRPRLLHLEKTKARGHPCPPSRTSLLRRRSRRSFTPRRLKVASQLPAPHSRLVTSANERYN
jgi:hypothetical protein